MKITIIYDNEVWKKGLKADWGFSCLLEVYNRKILFDTGTNGSILLENMSKLNIEPTEIEEIFISHAHNDHTGGLSTILHINAVPVYVPPSYQRLTGSTVVPVKGPTEIHENIFSTGELKGREQSLVVKTEKGLVVIVGCSHPGVGTILNAASQWGDVTALIGGLHGFSNYELLKDLDLICATHCTQHKSEIKSRYPDKYVEGGAGKIIEL